jgi:hypothetical protein
MTMYRSRSALIGDFYKKKDDAIKHSSKNGDLSVWSYEFAPYKGKDGKIAEGRRCYYAMTPQNAFKMIFEDEKSPMFRNYYEVIFGRCRLFADYDLAIPSIQKATGDAVMGVHTIIDLVVREKLAQQYPTITVKRIDYCILTAHIDGVKESMHVVWRLYGEDGREIVFDAIEEVRRFMALCVSEACDSLGISGSESLLPEDARNPLFDHSKAEHPCILDIGVYNEYRNFRLIHNVKADVMAGKKRSWLSDPSCNHLTAAMQGRPPSKIVLPEFLRHLVRVWDFDASTHLLAPVDVIDEDIEFPKYKASAVRHPAGTRVGSRGGSRASTKTQSGYQATLESLDSTLSRMSVSAGSDALRKIKNWALGVVNEMFPSDAHNLVHDTDGGFTITSDTYLCPYKGMEHTTAPGVHYIVSIEYPLPIIQRKCFKTECLASMGVGGKKYLSLDHLTQEAKETYALFLCEYLNDANPNK